VRGTSSVALGTEGTITKSACVHMGAQGNLTGDYSAHFGLGGAVSGLYAVHFGERNINNLGYLVTFGRFSASVSGSSVWADADPLVVFGNGTSTTARSNSMVIYKNGNIASIGGLALSYKAVTTTYTVLATDYVVDCTANSFTVTLPTAVGITGRQYIIKNSGTGTIVVDANTTQTIDGQLTQTLNQYDSLTIVSNGANWLIV